LFAAIASAVVPGVGQFIAGNVRRGAALVGVDIAILVGLYFYFGDALNTAQLWLQPSQLAAMMVGNIVLFGYRIWAADDAYRLAKRQQPRSVSASAGAMLGAGLAVVVILAVPHAVFGYIDVVQYDLITTVFGSSSPTTTVTPVTSPPVTTATGDTVPSTSTSEPVVVPDAPWDQQERLNILLIGGDFGEGRSGIRTDTMITVSIDPTTGDTAMFSVPRNWTQSPLPDGMGIWDCNCYPELINELWVAGENNPEAFPGQGTPSENAVKGVISEFLGIPIHYYAMVNLDGFVEIVDALGGVEVYVPSPLYDAEYPNEDGVTTQVIDIKVGLQKFDGSLALAYSRSRNQDSDYFRMSRQRCVIEAIVNQADPIALISNFQSLANVIKDNMQTDIPIEVLPLLIGLKPVIDLENLVSIRFIPPEYHLKFRDDGKPGRVPNTELVHDHVSLVIEDPVRAVQELGLEQLDEVCGDPNT
jgi:LCP family protein required for cell wall assembly